MDLLSWIVSLLCVAGCRWSSASPVLRLDHVVRPGQNVTLACELASDEVTWYQLRSDRQMLPLLTVTIDKLNQSIVSFHAVNNVRLRCDDSEGDALHYSSLKHVNRPRPPGPRRARLVKEDVTYSTVTAR
ncbi:hypothetical protein F2P81_022928 [Scophthalmus maximus]|uniref:Ig-like domain-containing protein n=1 Tax=Scophthalmus maximus TaxID=52904 RepID=A0A6A4RNL8_SCOMX|nr:hypothetical protein F2P81_022928 [Scophthalmus maximus]